MSDKNPVALYGDQEIGSLVKRRRAARQGAAEQLAEVEDASGALLRQRSFERLHIGAGDDDNGDDDDDDDDLLRFVQSILSTTVLRRRSIYLALQTNVVDRGQGCG